MFGVALLVTASPANAHPTTDRAASTDPFARFSLTAAQARTLQGQIDEQLVAAPGGKQISQNEVAYDGGHTIMTFAIPGQTGTPTSSKQAAPAADGNTKGCPYGDLIKWTCVYEFANWNENTNGRRLQFDNCGGRDFNTYNFRDKTSSWVNTTRWKVHVSNFTTTGSLVLLWEEQPNSLSAQVTAANDNKADYLDIRC
ncbi:hypothetical protein PWY87_26910 [Kribbella solani]|uniref:hypothetical protein n=1 Tax=Kribbella solani TaxID=236067 RepID=UPI0029AB9791|nr:hypothetical protein [Kribbella solani]MDX3005336.1 hypothetical protein [Kribbella solani]